MKAIGAIVVSVTVSTLVATAARADILEWQDAEGVRHYTNLKDEVPPERLNSFLDWLRFESVAGRSALTEAEAGRLAEESKQSWWDANKERLIPPGER